MQLKSILSKLAPFAIVGIIILFIYDIWSHGQIVHPGKAQYASACAQCHGDNGEGIKSLVPPLNRSDFATRNIDSLPCWLKFGMNHPIVVNDTTFDQPMYPNAIDEVQTANLINFMNSEFFKNDKEVNSRWVLDHWKDCK